MDHPLSDDTESGDVPDGVGKVEVRKDSGGSYDGAAPRAHKTSTEGVHGVVDECESSCETAGCAAYDEGVGEVVEEGRGGGGAFATVVVVVDAVRDECEKAALEAATVVANDVRSEAEG